MERRTIRSLRHAALAAALGLSILAPATAFAANPAQGLTPGGTGGITPATETSPSPAASDASQSPSASDGSISIDPTFITPTQTPASSVLSATGLPDRTLPPTDAVAGAPNAGSDARGALPLLLALATISLVAARLPEVRRR